MLATSLRNFFITFVLALLIFGGLAVHYYGDLLALLPGQATEESGGDDTSQTESSGDTSSGTEIVIPEGEGDNLGILHGLIVTKNADGEVLSARFVRINSERNAVITCNLSLSAVLYNEVGSVVPLRDYLRIYGGETSSAAIASLVGYGADFYLELTPDALDEMIENMMNPHFLVAQEIHYVNPIYAEVTFAPGAAYPTDYYKHVDAGEITLTKDTLATLQEHYGLCDGTDGHISYDALLSDLFSSLLGQLMTEQKTVMLSDRARYAAVFSGASTNLDAAFLAEWGDLLMKYNDYQKVEIPYTSRDATLRAFKEADR